jgi:hypothetical protein
MSTLPTCGRQRTGCFLLALTIGLLTASCSLLESGTGDTVPEGFTRLRDTARSVIGDPVRLEHFLARSEEFEAELLDFERYANEFAGEYRSAFTDYNSSQRDLRLLSEAFRERQRTAQGRFVELHLAMAESVTESEWRSIRKQEARIIESMLNAAIEGSG